MQFNAFYGNSAPVISFEVFPPKSDAGLVTLKSRLGRLKELKPSFITVTYGALGTARERTLEIASTIRNDLGLDVAHHLTCVAASKGDIDRILEDIEAAGIENIVALRGDPPRGADRFERPEGGFKYASELVGHIHRKGRFGIAVAGYPEKHPEAPDMDTDIRNLKTKVDAGADVILTQLFYDNRHFFEFVDRCRDCGIGVPIVPGLLPIINTHQIKRITRLCGTALPEALARRLDEAGDDEERVHRIGVEHTADQALELLHHGVPGIHFYVLNQYFHIAEVIRMIAPQPAPDSRLAKGAVKPGPLHS